MKTTEMQEIEQKLKLTVSNLISIVMMLGSLILVYSTLNSRLAILEKESIDNKERDGKVDFKLDKIIESTNRISIDVAVLKVRESEKQVK